MQKSYLKTWQVFHFDHGFVEWLVEWLQVNIQCMVISSKSLAPLEYVQGSSWTLLGWAWCQELDLVLSKFPL